ncbi:MAG TPA: hypothetical protein VHH88_06850 [Verrucomicrobiae bacterium]|nr:hypothetical protein [Verrucomicrobiae bacterium]
MKTVGLNGSPLRDVIAFLSAESKRQDPEGKGVNFYLVSGQASAQRRGDSANGNLTTPVNEAGLGNVLISLSLQDVTFVNALDAIPNASAGLVQFSIEPDGVAFSFRNPANPLPTPLYSRIFHGDTAKMAEARKSVVLHAPESAFFSDSSMVVHASMDHLNAIQNAIEALGVPATNPNQTTSQKAAQQ